MKRIKFFLISALILLSDYAICKPFDTIEINAGFNIGWLLSGKQKEFFSSVLSPSPDSISTAGLNASLRYFPMQKLGLMFGVNTLNVQAGSDNYEPLELLTAESIKFGIASRFSIYLNGNPRIDINLNAGGTYNHLEYSSDFSSLMPYPDVLYDIKQGFGYFAEIGFQKYFLGKLSIGCSFQYLSSLGIINTSNLNFDGQYFIIPIFFGYSF
jgi:hypothetical protein